VVTLAAGMISALLSGLAAIWGLLRFLQQSSTRVFVIYRVVIGFLVIMVLVTGVK